VLLENNGALPLSPTARLLVTGPAADSRRLLCGGWTNHWQGPVDDSATEFPHLQPTVAQKLAELHGTENVLVQPGITFTHGADGDVSGADAALVCLPWVAADAGGVPIRSGRA
jgi:beta-glucosidase